MARKMSDPAKKAMDVVRALMLKNFNLEYPKHYDFTPPSTFIAKNNPVLRAIGIRPKDIETTKLLMTIDEKVLKEVFPELLNFGFKTSYGHPSKNFYYPVQGKLAHKDGEALCKTSRGARKKEQKIDQRSSEVEVRSANTQAR